MTTLVAEVRALGHLPRLTEGLGAEYALACRLREAKRQGHLSESQVAELEAMPKYDPKRERAERMTTLVAKGRPFGRVPQLTDGNMAQLALADRLRWATRRG